jgi:hypothetical protein
MSLSEKVDGIALWYYQRRAIQPAALPTFFKAAGRRGPNNNQSNLNNVRATQAKVTVDAGSAWEAMVSQCS